MICKRCNEDKPYFAKELCRYCYNQIYEHNRRNNALKLIYQISRPLKRKEVEHNLKVIYARLRKNKKTSVRFIYKLC